MGRGEGGATVSMHYIFSWVDALRRGGGGWGEKGPH